MLTNNSNPAETTQTVIDRTTASGAKTKAIHWSQPFFFKLFRQLKHGELVIYIQGKSHYFGEPVSDELRVRIDILDPKAFSLLLSLGTNGAAEGYMNGFWTTDNLTGLIQLMIRNQTQLDAMQSGVAKFMGLFAKIWHGMNRNSKTGSKKNIAAHYDLGNDFFRLFLDKNLMYSSAIFPTGQESLETASDIKLDTICQKLQLTPQDHLLEIGTGWGGMAIYAAKHYGCKVTTTTISQEQFNAAKERVATEGLEDKITLLKQDYRDLEGQFDKLVSIEMVEAVGHQYLAGYFEKISQLLTPQGIAVVQAITIDDLRYPSAVKAVDFIKRYIFPGSFIPCVNVLTQTAAQQGLRLYNLEDIGTSYATTIHHWSTRFEANMDQVKTQGFDQRFIQMWRFYLSYCEGGFRERAISDVQLLFTKFQAQPRPWLKGVE